MTDTSAVGTAATPEAGELDPNPSDTGGAVPENLPELDTDQGTGRQKGLRARAQAAEAERDSALATLSAVRMAEIRRLAGERLADPDDLLTFGSVSHADGFCGEDGLVDPALVAAEVEAVIENRPGLARAELKAPPRGYQQQGQFQPPPKSLPSRATWSKALGR